MTKSKAFLFVLFIFSTCLSFAQDTIVHIKVPGKIINGDTIPFIDLDTYYIFPPSPIRNPKEQKKYDKLVYNVRKVYPYAKLAGIKLLEYKKALDSIHGEKEQKIFLKNAEKELENKFGEQIKGLTFSQGKILIKLVYRETGSSTFDIVKELRGNFNAFMKQTLARIFGYNLKTTYDPQNEDQAIETIVLMIESGVL